MGLCAVSRWCEGCRNKGKAQLSSALDRISERITLAFQTLSRPELIRGVNLLKAFLNHAWNDEKNAIPSDQAWRKVKPFKDVARPRDVRFAASGEETDREYRRSEIREAGRGRLRHRRSVRGVDRRQSRAFRSERQDTDGIRQDGVTSHYSADKCCEDARAHHGRATWR